MYLLKKLHRMIVVNSKNSPILEFIRGKSKFIIADEQHMVPAETFTDSIEFIMKLTIHFYRLPAVPCGYYADQTEQLSNYFLKNKITITDDNNKILDEDEPINYLQNIKSFMAKIKTYQVKTDFNFELQMKKNKKSYQVLMKV